MRRELLCYIWLCLLSFLTLNARANDIKNIGVPYIQNFPKSVYLSGNQNWSIAKDNSQVMYFGNAQGLLTYDGRYWQQYAMLDNQIVRSVATAADGTIYSGAYGELGYWKVLNRQMRYTSLTHLLPKGHRITEEIWKIYVDGNRVLFQSFSAIYIYQDGKINVIKAPATFLFLHQSQKRFFIEILNQGLYELKDTKLVPLRNAGSIYPTSILSVLPFADGKLLIGTSKQGLFIYDGTAYTRYETAANDFLMAYQLNNGVQLKDRYYAYGTILNGIIIIDTQGRIVQRINKSSGLNNNTVLSLYADSEQNLWAGLDNGIDRIELNTPLHFYFDKTGKFGTVYSSIIHQGYIYLGTNQGLFYSPWPSDVMTTYHDFDFKLVPNSQGQVWDLSLVDGQLLCGHNEGTFVVRGSKIEKLSAVNGGWTIRKIAGDQLIQGTYNGLVLFKRAPGGNWVFDTKIAGFGEPSRYVEQDANGDIWVSHAYKGLYRLKLSADHKRVISTQHFDERNGLPGTFNINIFRLANKMLFTSLKGFLNYDEITNRFSPYTSLNKAVGSFATSNKVITAGKDNYWFINHGKVGLVTFNSTGTIRVDSNRFNILDNRMVQYYENISRINPQLYLISVDDGFVIYDTEKTAPKNPNLPRVLIRKVEDITDTEASLSEGGIATIHIPYDRNNIRISFSLPYYRQAKVKYQYYLEGYSKQWSDWSSASQKDFTNLVKGNYVFKVRAQINDRTLSEVTEFKFSVSPPWYASNLAIAFYVLLILGAVAQGRLAYKRKLLKHQDIIRMKLQAEKDEFMKKEAEATEKQIVKLQTEKLHAELASKNRELANSAMSLVYKNELLQKLSQEMLKVKDEHGKPLPEEQLRKIQKVIDEGMNDQRDWNLFENSFNEAHESFFKKLKANHPDLVPNDLKLCAYLHMNMSSKEMASLLNISLRGVEIRRYRLRKKLNVPHDKNLVEFLMEL